MAATRHQPQPRQPSTLISFERVEPDSNRDGPRLGYLHFQGREPIDTPHYVAVSSRGTLPHLSQDMMLDNTDVKIMECSFWSQQVVEKAPQRVPPVFNFPAAPHESPLRKFIALQKDVMLVLGPRRVPPLPCPVSGTSTAISIVTCLGCNTLECSDYVEAIQKARPDVVLGMGDLIFGRKPGVKRMDLMGDRTLAWMNELVAGMEDENDGTPNSALFAPMLPIEPGIQSYYLDALQNDLKDKISGLVLYADASVEAIPEGLNHLPRLWLGEINSPHQLLDAVAAGIDIFTIPFITEATEAGIAFNFSFGAYQNIELGEPIPLGLDLWSPSYATDLSPLCQDCACYACASHHRAFVQHLLNAKEMLGWILLQLHNHNITEKFFAAVRLSIKRETFDGDRRIFGMVYEPKLPAKTGQGPRMRGYQFRSEGMGEPRKNPIAYRSLEDGRERLAEADSPYAIADGETLEQQGFAKRLE